MPLTMGIIIWISAVVMVIASSIIAIFDTEAAKAPGIIGGGILAVMFILLMIFGENGNEEDSP